MKTIRLTSIGLLLIAAATWAQTAGPSADYFYPTGSGAPLNTKVLVHTPCCGATFTFQTGALLVSGVTDRFVASTGQWILFTPTKPFSPQTTYTILVALPGFAPVTSTFVTGNGNDSTPPTVVSTSPGAGQDFGNAGPAISIRFSKSMDPSRLRAPSLVTANGNPISGLTWVMADAFTLTGTFFDSIPWGNVVRLYFPGELPTDLSGNATAGPKPDFIFTTYPEAPKDGPHLRGSTPAEGETGVPTNSALFLQFDRPLPIPADGVFSLSSDGDPRVPLRVETIAERNVLIVRPQTLLRGNQDYTLRADPFYDGYGGRFPGGPLLRFRTGVLPDGRSFQIVSSPAVSLPSVAKLQWRFSRPINPFVLPKLGRVAIVSSSTEIPLSDMRLLADGVTIEGDVTLPGRYLLAGPVYDRVEAKIFSTSGSTVDVSPTVDKEPPAAVAIFPSNPETAVPPSVAPIALFNEALQPFGPDDVTLWQGDQRIPADVTLQFSSLTIKPRQPLPAADYRVKVRAPLDLAGNAASDLEWTFRVDISPPPSDPFRILSVEPEDRSLNVDPHSTLVVTFNRPPNPVAIRNRAQVSSAAGAVAGRWRFEGSQAIFEPDQAFPPSTRITWIVFGTTDFYGAALASTATGGFWTAAADRPPDFRVTGAVPLSGSAVALEFSQPVDSSTVSDQTISVLLDGKYVSIQPRYEESTRRVVIPLNNPGQIEGVVQVAVGAGVRSQAGAALEPFSVNVPITPDLRSYSYPTAPRIGPFVRATVPQSGGTLAVNGAIIVYFTQPMQRDQAERALRVSAGSGYVNGRIEWAGDSQALSFFPSAPLPYGVRGTIVFSLAPFGGSGVEGTPFQTETKFSSPEFPRWNFPSTFAVLPKDAVIDVELDSDHPAGYIKSAVADSGTKQFPLEVSALSARIFRFRSRQPLEPGTYRIVAKTDGSDLASPFFQPSSSATPISRQITVGPTEAMGETPVNALIWLQSSTPLNPIRFKAQISSNGVPGLFATEFSNSGYLVRLLPIGLLRSNATYSVVITGLEDIAGRPLPDRSWTFRTGSSADLTPTQLTSSTPQGIAPRSSVLRATFNKPVYFLRQPQGSPFTGESDFRAATAAGPVSGAIMFSADGRTLSYLPDNPWPLNSPVTITVDRVSYFDWTGAPISEVRGAGYALANPAFTTPVSAGEGPPKVEAVNPPRGASDAPINAQIQARFLEPVLQTSLSRVRLEADGNPVPARVTIAADGRTISLATDGILTPNRTYSVILEGVQNGDGVSAEIADRWDFRTGQFLAAGSTTASLVVIPGELASFRADSVRPVNPLSVEAAAFELLIKGLRVAVKASVDEGGRSVFIEPRQPSPADSPGSLHILLRDWAGNPISARGEFGAVTAIGSDSAPPKVQSVLPASGSVISWNDAAALVLDKPFFLRYGAGGVVVKNRRTQTAVEVQPDVLSTRLTLLPGGGWVPGESYDLEVRGIMGPNGAESPAVSWGFQIAADGLADSVAPRLVASTPPFGAVGVPPDTAVVLEFSKPILPFDFESAQILAPANAPHLNLGYLTRPVYQANRVQLTDGPLPAGLTISAGISVRDMAGLRVNSLIQFSTAAVPDDTPPRLESISPAPGAKLFAGVNNFVLRFSEPISVIGQWIRFSSGGTAVYPDLARYPAQGDGRSFIVTFTLPENSTGTIDILSGVADLSGNMLASQSLTYTTGAADDVSILRVASVKPMDGNPEIPVDAEIELRFNQAVERSSLLAGLSVWNDGALIPVSVSPDADLKTWRITHDTPWHDRSTVAVGLADTVFGVSGTLQAFPFYVSFRTAGTLPNNTSTNALAAVNGSATAIDLRFAQPRSLPPGEPFGIRIGQERVSAHLEQLGEAWFRLTPDIALDRSKQYYLMAGPGVEVPIRFPFGADANSNHAEYAIGESDADRIIHAVLAPDIHPFQVGRGAVAVYDEHGRPVPHQTSLAIGSHTILIELFGRAATYRLVTRGTDLTFAAEK